MAPPPPRPHHRRPPTRCAGAHPGPLPARLGRGGLRAARRPVAPWRPVGDGDQRGLHCGGDCVGQAASRGGGLLRLRRCKLVLASASPRRRELLAQMGYRFEAVAPDVDEAVDPSLPAERQAEVLAERKAEAVAGRVGKALVLGADTLVACEGRVIGKAADAAQAREFLRLLTSHRHAVITGLCALDTATGERQVAHDTTWVTMQPMSEAELDGYIAGCGWRDKAGAYAIQEGGDRFIERLDGSESNVVGLPVELVARLVPHSFSEHLGKLRRDVLARH
ncbi:MAG: septum formation protein Maf, partial [Planctomycetes bacterium]|nr:septum formation protein Maf [Planctomycetota bacterium]